MLSYTQEERETIIENLKKVQEYISTKIVPRLRTKENVKASIQVGYDTLTLCACGDGEIWFQIGNLYLHFDEKKYPDENIFICWTYGTRLLANWYSIKATINQKLNQMDDEREKVLNFNV